ncbi:virulence protein [Akkermansia sp.]|uniref:virulence protein n=1 Tax=Akkermansia sp. TaxID=1872421 RepID=UPI0031B8AF74
MEVKYNVTGARCKELAQVISKITGAKAEYQYMSTCAYEIGSFTLTKEGTLVFSDRSDTEIVEEVLDGIAEAGFEAAPAAGTAAEETAEEESEGAEKSEHGADVGLTVALPLDKVSVGNLTKLLDAKGNLIKKALGIDATPIEISEDAVSFPWFSEMPDADTVRAYTHFISALCQMSREQKRITATEKNIENEKYAFRCFLLRLGFIGAEYKTERKILLKNLTGSSAFKNGGADHAVSK